MRSPGLLVFLISAFISTCSIAQAADTNPKTSTGLTYPKVKRINKTWSYRSAKANSNVTYNDPYFWLEKASKDKSVQEFISDQTNVTDSFMKRCTNLKQIQQSIQHATDYDQFAELGLFAESSGSPFYLYTLKRVGDQRPTWYKASVAEFEAGKKNNFAQPPGKPFLKEVLLSPDGTANIVAEGVIVSPNGKIFCYLVSEGNSDFSTWYFRSIDNPLVDAKTFPKGGEGRIPVSIPFNQQNIEWTSDGKGFFYVQAETKGDATANNMVRYHEWGTTTDKDITVVQPAPVWFIMTMSRDGRWITVLAFKDTSYNQIAYTSLLDGQPVSEKMKWISVSPGYDYQVYYITTIDDTIYFQTNHGNATNSKIAKVKLDWSKARPSSILTDIQDRPQVQDVVKERPDASIPQLNAFAIAHDKVLINYIENGKDALYLYDLKTGKMVQHLLPKGRVS